MNGACAHRSAFDGLRALATRLIPWSRRGSRSRAHGRTTRRKIAVRSVGRFTGLAMGFALPLLFATSRPVPPTPAPIGLLAAKIVATYHWAYDPPTLSTMMALAPQYNHASWVIAVGDGSNTGFVRLDTAVNTAEVDAWKASGRTIVVSVGGSNPNGLVLLNGTHAAQFLRSISSIIDANGFQGIDIDLEGGSSQWSPAVLASVCGDLRAKYGPTFIIAISPRPFEIRSTSGIYAQFVRSFGVANIDLVQPQWYGQSGQADSWYIDRYILPDISTLIGTIGIPASKILIGCSTVADGGGAPEWPTTYLTAYQRAVGAGEEIRGVINWQDAGDQSAGWAFAAAMGPAVK